MGQLTSDFGVCGPITLSLDQLTSLLRMDQLTFIESEPFNIEADQLTLKILRTSLDQLTLDIDGDF
jgi:hypothetical protein